jgi:mRNA-degrading endonuclease RelE of RelBE toxin-antitoxin system
MLVFQFTHKALKEWMKLDESVRNTLNEKLKELKNPDLYEAHIKTVVDLLPATHRIRIGYYRLLIKREDHTVTIYSVGHRREIYK